MSFPFLLLSSLLTLLRLNPKLAGRSSNLHQELLGQVPYHYSRPASSRFLISCSSQGYGDEQSYWSKLMDDSTLY
ncbi:unnamed protein product [Linum tenue]|uniref:Uncharacterized protein n=1 Tax=Linum tenue TaxID=586396 RepID=A0AAV0R0V9_9ROSI|nr:unnamed protein product [Linum tenue]